MPLHNFDREKVFNNKALLKYEYRLALELHYYLISRYLWPTQLHKAHSGHNGSIDVHIRPFKAGVNLFL